MSISEHLDAAIDRPRGSFECQMNYYGLRLAKVTSIQDEKNLNRIKCLPIGAPDEEETDWCYVMTPMGGKESGLLLFPQVDDLVVLAYIDGNPHRPMVMGGFWTSDVPAPGTIQDGKNQDYLLKTPKKVELAIHDEDDKQKVTLTMPSGTALTIDDEAKEVSIKDKGGDNSLVMGMEKGEITLKSKTKLTLQAGDTSITLESSGDIKVKGTGAISVEGTNVSMKGNTKLELKSTAVSVAADGTMELKSSGTAALKGAIVQIN